MELFFQGHFMCVNTITAHTRRVHISVVCATLFVMKKSVYAPRSFVKIVAASANQSTVTSATSSQIPHAIPYPGATFLTDAR